MPTTTTVMTTTCVLSAAEADGALWLHNLSFDAAGLPRPMTKLGAWDDHLARRRFRFADLNRDVLALVIRYLVRWEFPLDSRMRASVLFINKVFSVTSSRQLIAIFQAMAQAWTLAEKTATTLSVCKAWPETSRRLDNFGTLRRLSLADLPLPVGFANVLHASPQLEHVELRRCRVLLAFKGVATPLQRSVAFLDQFLEPVSTYASVVITDPRIVLVETFLPKLLAKASGAVPRGNRLVLDVAASEALGTVLHWAGKRCALVFFILVCW